MKALRIAIPAAASVVLALIACNVAATPSPSPATARPAPSGRLAPGTYRSDIATFTLPAGWTSPDGLTYLKPDANPPTGMVVNTWRIAAVYSDPCHWQTTRAAVGPTVDDVVAALATQKRGGPSITPVDVTIDGFHGKQIDLMVPLDVTFANCDGGQYHSWVDSDGGDRFNQGPGQHDLLQILDVRGTTLVIKESFYPANTAADRAELQAIVDSIKITPP